MSPSRPTVISLCAIDRFWCGPMMAVHAQNVYDPLQLSKGGSGSVKHIILSPTEYVTSNLCFFMAFMAKPWCCRKLLGCFDVGKVVEMEQTFSFFPQMYTLIFIFIFFGCTVVFILLAIFFSFLKYSDTTTWNIAQLTHFLILILCFVFYWFLFFILLFVFFL